MIGTLVMNDEKNPHQTTISKEALFASITALLFDADLMNINFVENADEYEMEASAIVALLSGANSEKDVHTIVCQVFCKYFEDMKPINSSFELVSQAIWDMIQGKEIS
jgi:hypothetical protein